MTPLISVLVALAVCFLGVGASSGEPQIEESCLRCNVMVANGLLHDGIAKPVYMCRTDPDQDGGHEGFMYRLEGLSQDFMENHERALATGLSCMCIPGGTINRKTNRIVIPSEDSISFLARDHKRPRRLLTTGDKKVLGVYVTVNGQAPVVTSSQMQGTLFGTGPNAANTSVMSQFRDCSFNKLRMEPAAGAGITNGMATIQLNDYKSWRGTNVTDWMNPLTEVLADLLGGPLTQWDHVLVCLPFGGYLDGSVNDWYGYSFFNYPLTFLNSMSCNYHSMLMHEMSHNLGLRHSAGLKNGKWNEYGDMTDLVSDFLFIADGPKYCYNGVKNNVLGWFNDKKLRVEGSFIGRLVATNDYEIAEASRNEFVLLEVTTDIYADRNRFNKVFVQWNSAVGINEGVYAYPNRVTVTTGPDEDPTFNWDGVSGADEGRGFSYFMAALDQKEIFETLGGVTIEVCGFSYKNPQGLPDHAIISVHRLGESSLCDQVAIAPSTPRPTISIDAPYFHQMPTLPKEEWTAQPQSSPVAPPLTPPPTITPTSSPPPTPTSPPTPKPPSHPPTLRPTARPFPGPVAVSPLELSPVSPTVVPTADSATPPPTPIAPTILRPILSPTAGPVAASPVDSTGIPSTVAPTPLSVTPRPTVATPPTVRPTPLSTIAPTTAAPLKTTPPISPQPTTKATIKPTPPRVPGAPIAIAPVSPRAPTTVTTSPTTMTLNPTNGTSGSGTFCFPGSALVTVKDVGQVPLFELRLEDHVLVDPWGKFEPVYSFGHYNEVTRSQYLQLETSQSILELSHDHMVFIETIHRGLSNTYAVPAKNVNIGDNLIGTDGIILPVQSVRTVVRMGAFAPFTPSGTLMINGIHASSYVSFQNEHLEIGNVKTPFSYQWLAHTFQFPHRMFCVYLGTCVSETYTKSGISTWVDTPLQLTSWWLDRSIPVQVSIALPLLVLLTVFSAFEFLVHQQQTVCLGLIVALLFLQTRARVKTV